MQNNQMENIIMERQTRVNITPAMAEAFLEKSNGNRSLRQKTKLLAYKKDMLRGVWFYNGDSIRFSEQGVLLDGHHRLTACIETGVSFEADISVIPKSSLHTIDKGGTRSDADSLVMDYGYDKKEAGLLGASAKQIICHDLGHTNWPNPGGALSHVVTYHVIHEWIEANGQEIRFALDYVASLERPSIIIPASHIFSAFFMGCRIYPSDFVEGYLNKVFTGFGLTPDTTESHIRTALLQSRMAQRKMPTYVAAMSVAKGMKSRMKGKNIVYRSNAVHRPNVDNPVFYK